MKKLILILNAVVTLSFAIPCLIVPAEVFAGFGLTLDTAGQLVARGYAAACAGYGTVFWLCRNVTEPLSSRGLLIGSILFNFIEVGVQTPAALSGGVSPAIWVTIINHGLIGLLSVVQFNKERSA